MRLALVSLVLAAPLAAQQPVPALVAAYDQMAARPLWPGFKPAAIPLAIWDGQRTWLVRHPHPPEGFQPTPLVRGARVIVGRLAEVHANTHADINGVPTATLMWPAAGGDPARLAAVMLHEAFHVYQNTHHPGWYGNEATRFTYPATDSAARALQRLETEALRQALQPGADLRCWTARAVALHRERAGQIGDEAMAYERGNDLNEGLATWVQWTGGGLPWDSLVPAAGFGPDQVRDRTYAVGPAQAELLQRLLPDWKTRLDRDTTQALDRLLTEATLPTTCGPGFTDAERDSVAARAGREAAAVLATRDSLRQEFLSRRGWQLAVELPAGNPLWPQAFDPLNVTPLPQGEVLHRRQLTLAGPAGKLDVLDQWVLTGAAGDHPLFSGIRWALLSGFTRPPRLELRGDTVLVNAPGLEGRFAGLVADTVARRITLRPR